MFGLSQETIHDIQSVFENFPNVEEVLIFGLRATGNYREGSDIDLAIIGSNITFDEILEISSRIDDLGLLYNVDVLNYDQQNGTSIDNEIDKYGKTFYRKKPIGSPYHVNLDSFASLLKESNIVITPIMSFLLSLHSSKQK